VVAPNRLTTGQPAIADSVLDLIGHTPLVRLSRIGEEGAAEVLGKFEVFNPAGSVKDRIALSMVEAAERDGAIKPGDTLVEPTPGNTGIGLAVLADALGYKTVIVIPETQSQEKKDALRLLGAHLVEVFIVNEIGELAEAEKQPVDRLLILRNAKNLVGFGLPGDAVERQRGR